MQVECAVEGGLTSHRRQKSIRAFLGNDSLDRFPVNGLDIDCVGRLRIGHDRRRVGINEYDPVPLFLKRLACLRPGIIKFTSLADNDRAGTNDQDTVYVGSFWHSVNLPPVSGGMTPVIIYFNYIR